MPLTPKHTALKALQKRLENLAQIGFEKAGIAYKPHAAVLDDDDPDTATRSLIDIYGDAANSIYTDISNEISQVAKSWSEPATRPVAANFAALFREKAALYAFSNENVLKAINAWIQDRNAFSSPSSPRESDDDAQQLYAEFYAILLQFGVIRQARAPWIQAAHAVCDAQKRFVKNTLTQAERLLKRSNEIDETSDLPSWLDAMNSRLMPFGFALVSIDSYLTLVDTEEE